MSLYYSNAALDLIWVGRRCSQPNLYPLQNEMKLARKSELLKTTFAEAEFAMTNNQMFKN
jgi:hypothetical protein